MPAVISQLKIFKGITTSTVQGLVNAFLATQSFASLAAFEVEIDEMDDNGSSMVVKLFANSSAGVQSTHCKMFSGSDLDAVITNANAFMLANSLNNTNCKISFTGMDFNSTSQIAICIIYGFSGA